jgi:5-methylcytosine-specific restriction endonuclease McrA
VTDAMISKFYGSKDWRFIRQTKLNANPLCQSCIIDTPSKIATAKQVHHSVNLRLGWELRFDIRLLFSLCDSCHQAIESEIRQERQAAARAVEEEVLRKAGG